MQREMTRQVSDLISAFVASQQKSLAASSAQHHESVTNLHKSTVAQVESRAVIFVCVFLSQQNKIFSLFLQHEARARQIDSVLVPASEARQQRAAKELAAVGELLQTHAAASAARIEV